MSHSAIEPTDETTSPPFDPDPELVADLEGNPASVRDYRQAAEVAHAEAEREGDLRAAR